MILQAIVALFWRFATKRSHSAVLPSHLSAAQFSCRNFEVSSKVVEQVIILHVHEKSFESNGKPCSLSYNLSLLASSTTSYTTGSTTLTSLHDPRKTQRRNKYSYIVVWEERSSSFISPTCHGCSVLLLGSGDVPLRSVVDDSLVGYVPTVPPLTSSHVARWKRHHECHPLLG